MSDKDTTSSTKNPSDNDGSSSAKKTDFVSTAPTVDRQVFRAAILVTVLCASVYGTRGYSAAGKHQHVLLLVHLLSFSSWFGCSIWVSFIAGLVMFKTLQRHTFGRLQARLFPAYFQFSAVMVSISIVSATALGWWKDDDASGGGGGGIQSLATILVAVFANLVYLEPETTRVMFQRHAVERKLGTGHEIGQLKPSDPEKANDPELRALSKKFGMLHGISSLMNLVSLGVGCYWLNFCALQMMPCET